MDWSWISFLVGFIAFPVVCIVACFILIWIADIVPPGRPPEGWVNPTPPRKEDDPTRAT
jgi:hypothetical protein